MSDLEQRVVSLEKAIDRLSKSLSLANDNAKLRSRLLADMTYHMGMRITDMSLSLARQDYDDAQLQLKHLHEIWDEIEKIKRDGQDE